jgi:AraC-like DNA-binding protein
MTTKTLLLREPFRNKGFFLIYAFCFLPSAFCLLLSANIGYAQSPNAPANNDLISKYKHLTTSQLLDTANYYHAKGSADTALVCFSLIINSTVVDMSIEHQQRIVEACATSGLIYYFMCDYHTAYQLFIKGLLLCEKFDIQGFSRHRILTNLGNIYARFDRFDIAKQYYLKALQACSDSTYIVVILSNLGATELADNNLDSALSHFNTLLPLIERHNNIFLCQMLNNMALIYKQRAIYDSAYYYYQQAFNEAKKNNQMESEAMCLSDLGTLFFEMNKTDSALHYIKMSNKIAAEHHFLGIMSANYLKLSKIEEKRGNIKDAFKYFKEYANLNDSVYSTKIFGDINQMQRLYEVSKANQQIERLVIEQQIKERIIHYRTLVLFIALGILLFVSAILLFVFVQKRRLNTAYKVLFEKNMEIISLQKQSQEKYKKSTLTYDMQQELLNKIYAVMEDSVTVCDNEFTVDKLAKSVNSNRSYVSSAINDVLKTNFNAFVNKYRIQEAQRLLSDHETEKYTIEFIASKVGFKSQTTFREAFKENTGVSPGFYLKSLKK